jgi:Ribbon-helix-helix protein, copG family
MKTLSLKLPDALDLKLAAAVARRGAKKSDIVREAIERYVSEDETAKPGSLLEALADLTGSVEGPADLSTNPRYMEGFGRDSADRRRRSHLAVIT